MEAHSPHPQFKDQSLMLQWVRNTALAQTKALWTIQVRCTTEFSSYLFDLFLLSQLFLLLLLGLFQIFLLLRGFSILERKPNKRTLLQLHYYESLVLQTSQKEAYHFWMKCYLFGQPHTITDLKIKQQTQIELKKACTEKSASTTYTEQVVIVPSRRRY